MLLATALVAIGQKSAALRGERIFSMGKMLFFNSLLVLGVAGRPGSGRSAARPGAARMREHGCVGKLCSQRTPGPTRGPVTGSKWPHGGWDRRGKCYEIRVLRERLITFTAQIYSQKLNFPNFSAKILFCALYFLQKCIILYNIGEVLIFQIIMLFLLTYA